jgi:[acyl-carrier-protein] S-malonyltransferase
LLNANLSETRLGMPLQAILANNGALFSNRRAQPLIVAATIATWEALKQDVPAPTLVAGYSIGEVAAYGIAGALVPADTVALAALRARLMDACVDTASEQVLVAVSSLASRSASAGLQQCGFYLAIETGEDKFIAGGLAHALPQLQSLIANAGGHVTVLPVRIASHTPFMASAVGLLANALRRHGFTDPSIPVLSGISAELILDANKSIAHLSRQTAQPIRWADCMDSCVEAGVTVALELGPGAALSRMLQARHPQIACRTVDDFRSLAGVRKWLARHLD